MSPEMKIRVEETTQSDRIFLMIKGTPEMPMCGFSARVVRVLSKYDVQYSCLNIFEDMDQSAADIGIPGHERGIDILDIDSEKKIILITQVKWSDMLLHKLGNSDVQNLWAAPLLLYGGVPGNQLYHMMRQDFKDAIDSDEGYKIQLTLVTAGDLTQSQVDAILAFKKIGIKCITWCRAGKY